MFKKSGNSKYGDILTMILVVLIVVILCIVAYFGYDMYSRNSKTTNAQTAMAEFEAATKSVRKKKVTNTVDEPTDTGEVTEIIERENVPEDDPTASGQEVEGTGEQTPREKVMYEGYEMLGTIKIPATKCEYPILAEVTKHSIEVAVAKLYGPDLNTPGNVVIVGHNYRNGMFFSNNHKLKNGDSIYITSPEETVIYEIYNMYYTTPDDAEYMRRPLDEGAREISLSTCNDDSSQRLIIWAKEKVQ